MEWSCDLFPMRCDCCLCELPHCFKSFCGFVGSSLKMKTMFVLSAISIIGTALLRGSREEEIGQRNFITPKKKLLEINTKDK